MTDFIFAVTNSAFLARDISISCYPGRCTCCRPVYILYRLDSEKNTTNLIKKSINRNVCRSGIFQVEMVNLQNIICALGLKLSKCVEDIG